MRPSSLTCVYMFSVVLLIRKLSLVFIFCKIRSTTCTFCTSRRSAWVKYDVILLGISMDVCLLVYCVAYVLLCVVCCRLSELWVVLCLKGVGMSEMHMLKKVGERTPLYRNLIGVVYTLCKWLWQLDLHTECVWYLISLIDLRQRGRILNLKNICIHNKMINL